MAATIPLSQALANPDSRGEPRATPVDVFRKARGAWLGGQRIRMAALAEELNISRATLFRWVGNKELLLGEVLWSLYKPLREQAWRKVEGSGIDYIVGVFREINASLMFSEPLREFIRQDPEYALRVLTSKSCTIHARVVEANSALLQGQIDKGLVKPAMKPSSLSYFMVRLAESCLYSDVISGRPPELEELEEACTAVRILLGATPGTTTTTESSRN